MVLLVLVIVDPLANFVTVGERSHRDQLDIGFDRLAILELRFFVRFLSS